MTDGDTGIRTYGATRAKLTANGYAPVSALGPYGLAYIARSPAPLLSQHPVAVLCWSGLKHGKYGEKNVVALVLAGNNAELAERIRECHGDGVPAAELLERIRDVLAREGLTGGPVRYGDDGSELRPLRAETRIPLSSEILNGAFSMLFDGKSGPGSDHYSHFIPLDGKWSNGDLLAVKWDELPLITDDKISSLLKELEALPARIHVEHKPPPKPARSNWLGR